MRYVVVAVLPPAIEVVPANVITLAPGEICNPAGCFSLLYAAQCDYLVFIEVGQHRPHGGFRRRVRRSGTVDNGLQRDSGAGESVQRAGGRRRCRRPEVPTD